jgi:hypothetical protein
MKRRIVATIGVLPLVLAFAAAPIGAQQQQGDSPIDAVLRRAQDYYNDLNFTRADSVARGVLSLATGVSNSQRTRAMIIIAASAYPDDPPAQKRAVALGMLKQLVKSNMDFKIPQELTWPGLDSIVDEAKRSTFAIAATADTGQVLVGPTAMGTVRIRGNRPATYRITIMPAGGAGGAAVFDSIGTTSEGTFNFPSMRNDRPVFNTGDYTVLITAVDSIRRDTSTIRTTARVESPSITSSKLLPIRSKRFGAKAIFPAVLVGAGAFALSSVLRADGVADSVSADSKGVMVGGALALSTILAGFADRGRMIPENIAANKAAGEAFQKSIVDTQAENRRRIAEHKTTIRFELEAR